MGILLGKHSKMNRQELESEGCRIASEIIDIANEIDPYASIPEILDTVDLLKNKISDFESVSHHWHNKYQNADITSATDLGTQKLYKISYGFSDLDSEGIPSFYDDVDYLYAYSEEDAEKKFEENLREDYGVDEHGHVPGYEGCVVHEANPEEVEKHEFWKQDDRRDEAIAYVTNKVRELGIPESQVSDYVDDCVEVLEDYYAFDDIPEWVDAGCDASYWADWETRNLFEEGFPDNIIEEICSGATTIEDEESTVYL